MTRQPWPSKAVMDHCTSKEEVSQMYVCVCVHFLPKKVNKENPLVLTQLNSMLDTKSSARSQREQSIH